MVDGRAVSGIPDTALVRPPEMDLAPGRRGSGESERCRPVVDEKAVGPLPGHVRRAVFVYAPVMHEMQHRKLGGQ
ncbi:MAG: hypothetical protein ACRDQ6_10235, partial [Pseudonocardiaceae bacterium]